MTFAARTLGAGGSPLVLLTDRTYDSTQSSPTDAWAGVQYASSGAENGMNNATSLSWNYTGIGWLLEGAAADYWVKATVNSGSVSGSATGSWLQLNADRSWYINELGIGFSTANLTIQISTDSSGVDIVGTCTIDLSVDVEP